MRINSVCILGGTGFVGQLIVSKLTDLGIRVRVLTRHSQRNRNLLVLPNIEVVEANIFDQTELEKNFRDVQAVINLVGILNEKQHNGTGFRKVHLDLPRTILNSCLAVGTQRLLHMSALNADAGTAPSHYLRTKGEGESAIHTYATNKVQVTSFRPSVIFGSDDSFFNRFAKLLQITPVFFPLACPNTRFSPVYVNDVVDFIVDSLKNDKSFGARYDICGPKEYTLKELVQYTADVIGSRCKVIGLPKTLSKIQANIFEWFPGKPFSVDNYNSLKVDSICSDGIQLPTSIESIVPTYLGTKNAQARYDSYRKSANREH